MRAVRFHSVRAVAWRVPALPEGFTFCGSGGLACAAASEAPSALHHYLSAAAGCRTAERKQGGGGTGGRTTREGRGRGRRR
eukprot:7733501-Pyramimonas_sp.AAC.2